MSFNLSTELAQTVIARITTQAAKHSFEVKKAGFTEHKDERRFFVQLADAESLVESDIRVYLRLSQTTHLLRCTIECGKASENYNFSADEEDMVAEMFNAVRLVMDLRDAAAERPAQQSFLAN